MYQAMETSYLIALGIDSTATCHKTLQPNPNRQVNYEGGPDDVTVTHDVRCSLPGQSLLGLNGSLLGFLLLLFFLLCTFFELGF
jgi:hypothetical protein